MNSKLCVRTILHTLIASLAAVSSSAFAQEPVEKSTPATESRPKNADVHAVTDLPLKPLARLDADANNDGIIDSVQSLSVLKQVLVDESKSSCHSTLQKDLNTGFRKAHVLKRPKPRNTCMDYLMLSSEGKHRVNQRVQQRTGGVFGSRPCDPYVSESIERPFDNEYVELPVLPMLPFGSIQGVIVK